MITDNGDFVLTPGQRIRGFRKRRGLTAVQVAGLCGKSVGWLKKIESGERGLPQIRDLVRLAEVLGVDNLVDITGDTATRTLTALGRPSHPSLPAIRSALTSYRLADADDAPPVDVMRGRVEQAWRVWHTSKRQRSDIGALLPGLLTDAQRLVRVHADDEHRAAAQIVLADVYHLAQQMLAWMSEPELVWMAADRGMAAAQASGHQVAVAGASWCVGNLLRAVGRGEEAEDLALEAAALLDRAENAEQVAIRGALRVHAGLTAAKEHSFGDAWRYWDAASEDVASLPADYVHPWTVFGAGNLAVHAVSIDVELGRSREAIDRTERLDLAQVPSTERRARALVEGARAYVAEQQDVAALHLFQRAETESPETVRYAAPARHLIPVLVSRSTTTTRGEFLDMAGRLEIPV